MKKPTLRERACNLWLIGTMFKARGKEYLSALEEFFYLCTWSLAPFMLAAIISYAINSPGQSEFLKLFVDTFRNGELLVFTISMLAPIFFFILKEPDKGKIFPHRYSIFLLSILEIIICACLFGVIKASAAKNSSFIFNASIILTISAFAVRFIAILYHKTRMPDLSEIDLVEQSNRAVKSLTKHLMQRNDSNDGDNNESTT